MITSNSTPLIYLAKVQQLELLRKLFRQIVIPPEVRKEVVDEGKKLQKPDAFLIEKEISSGWIKVREPEKRLSMPFEIEQGEKAVIALACNLNVKVVLIDEKSARTVAKLFDLMPRGTMYVLLRAVQEKLLTFGDFLHVMERLAEEGFRLHEEIYMKTIEKAREMKGL